MHVVGNHQLLKVSIGAVCTSTWYNFHQQRTAASQGLIYGQVTIETVGLQHIPMKSTHIFDSMAVSLRKRNEKGPIDQSQTEGNVKIRLNCINYILEFRQTERCPAALSGLNIRNVLLRLKFFVNFDGCGWPTFQQFSAAMPVLNCPFLFCQRQHNWVHRLARLGLLQSHYGLAKADSLETRSYNLAHVSLCSGNILGLQLSNVVCVVMLSLHLLL